MKNLLLIIFIIFSLVILSSMSFAKDKKNNKDNNWRGKFVSALQKGKAASDSKGGGLGYTPAQSVVLEEAIKAAMDAKAPACEAMKIAVDLEYSPYAVIKNIFGSGGEVKLNQLCMCATESGINKQIVAKAATDAMSPLGKAIFERDEITQAQCIGLGYTPIVSIPPRTTTKKPPPPFSESRLN